MKSELGSGRADTPETRAARVLGAPHERGVANGYHTRCSEAEMERERREELRTEFTGAESGEWVRLYEG
eukprot:6196023-Pleurochrysis_carterae.AAC.1